MVDFAAIGQRLTDIRSKSFDPSTRKIVYVAATNTPIERTVKVGGKDVRILEILPPEACRNINDVAQTPILDNHNCFDSEDQLGVQLRAWVEDLGNGVRGVVVEGEMLERDDVRRMDRDIAAGRISKMSAGYRINDAKVDKSTMPWTVTATDWQLNETSFTPRPADRRASVRSLITPEPEEKTMDPKKLETILATALDGFRTAVLDAVRSDGETDAARAKRMEEEEAERKRKADEDKAKEAESKDGKKTNADDGKRSEAIGQLRTMLGSRSAPGFEAAVTVGAPVETLRVLAYEAIGSGPAPRELTPPADQGRSDGKQTDFSSLAGAFAEFGGVRKDDVGARVASAVAEALKGLKA